MVSFESLDHAVMLLDGKMSYCKAAVFEHYFFGVIDHSVDRSATRQKSAEHIAEHMICSTD